MKKQPKDISKWGLSPKAKKIVKDELSIWLNHFIDNADGMIGNVYRCDFIKWDFFYFTDCKDLMKHTVESKAVESNKDIHFRKDQVFMQLFVKTLLGDIEFRHSFCSHCGDETVIDAISNGHMYFCPSCGKTDLSVYPDTAQESFYDVQKKLWKFEQEKK